MVFQKRREPDIPCIYTVFVFVPAAGGNFYIQNRYAYNLFRLTIHTLLMLYAFSFLLPSYGLCLMCHQADADMVLSPFLAALLIFSRSICSCFFCHALPSPLLLCQTFDLCMPLFVFPTWRSFDISFYCLPVYP